MDELLDRLGKARYISTLDLTKGYWQVPLSPSSREKMAFSTPSDHWQYRVLPFGLHGAPATFQRLMDVILRPHQEYAAAYLDDVIIHSESWEAHLERLWRVLRELRQAVSSRPDGSEVPGIQDRPGTHHATGKESGSCQEVPPAHQQNPGTGFPGVGGLLPMFYPQFLLYSPHSCRS